MRDRCCLSLFRVGEPDPILVARARYATASGWGKRIGYGLFVVAIMAFFVGLSTSFNDIWGWLMIGSLIAGSLFLLPSIILGYAVKAAHRDDLGLPSGH